MPTIHVSGLDAYYEISGQGQALVFIHGLGSSSRDWAFQAEFFSKYFRVLTYDVRGHGQTGKAKGPYSVPMFAADLAELLEALGIEKAHLVGLSMGGWIAFQFAVDYPEMVRSLTIVNSWADMRPKNFRDRMMLFRRNVIFRFFSMRKIGEILSKGLFVKPEQAELRETFVESWARNHKPSYMAAMRAGANWSVADQLDRITQPTLVIAADEDYTPVEAKRAYVEKLPDARLVVIDDSRHATPVERPDEFNRVLFDFLREI